MSESPRSPASDDGAQLLTTAQVAERLQISIASVRTAIRDGRLRAYMPSGRGYGYRIEPSAVREWLEANRAGPKQQ